MLRLTAVGLILLAAIGFGGWLLIRGRGSVRTQVLAAALIGAVAAGLVLTDRLDLVPDEVEEVLVMGVLSALGGAAALLWLLLRRRG